MSKHEEKVIHEYDGIQELDNQLPKWWVYIFYVTIIWSAFYLYWYHLGGPGMSSVDEMNAGLNEVKELRLEAAKKNAPEDLAKLIGNADAIAAGKVEYLAKCVACHGTKGEGGIGPNLTDNHWLHGEGKPAGIVKVIVEGVPAKGMVPWGPIIPAQKINELAAFIYSLKGTNPPNGKAPQGKEYP